MTSRAPFRARHRPASENGFLGSLIDPIDRLTETTFSILILLTFTLAFRILKLPDASDQTLSAEYVNDLLIAAFGAILAWGVIDGVMFALISLFERGESHRLLKKIQTADTNQEAVDVIAEDLDHILEPITDENVRQKLYSSILVHLRDSQPRKIDFQREDFTAALGHIVVALLSVIPSLTPFLLFRNNPDLAIRASNIVSFLVLFFVGYRWGTYTGANPWKTGLILTTVAVFMVLVAIPLGG